MSGAARVGLAILGGLALMLGVAWIYQDAILLEIVEIAADRRTPVGPSRPVRWDSGPDPAGRAPAERPPNIVLILADDLGWNDLTFGGGGVAGGSVPTPHIDSIAREGVSFTAGYAANGTCAPSRAAIMSGRYGTRFGFEFTPTPAAMPAVVGRLSRRMPGRIRQGIQPENAGEQMAFDDMGMPASEITLAELLDRADYHSVHIGKWHLGRTGGMAPHDQGFDESLLMHSGLYLPEDDPDVVNSKQAFDPIDQFLWRALKYAASFNGSEAFEPERYLTDYYTDQAVKVIEANKDRSFFLYLAHWAPHTPLQASREDYEALSHIESHRERVYAAMIRALDRGVGRVLEALRRQGLEENTLVFFTSDNGGAHYIGLPEVNQPYRGWKISFFEGGIRVPYFVKWPAGLAGGQTFAEPVHHFDIYATAAAAGGVSLPTDREIDGVDLVPHVRSAAKGERTDPPHDTLFWRSGHYQVVLADGWKLQVNDRIDGDWLFDLNTDPTEQSNLAEREPERVAALRQLLAQHNAEQVEPLWPSVAEMPVNIDKTLVEHDAPDDEYIYWPN
ncbi:MAG: sulfatase-like hydrolase/transferase [Acidobacteria bacterium]|nr:sulfatase-like hydrolase/transferase [Candidatus Sulfomarinibacter kjeldsenii]